MSFYYLTTLHKSHCVKDALVASVTLADRPGAPCPGLVLSLGSKIEVWDISSSFYRKQAQEDLNFHAKHTLVVPNMQGLEDSILVMDLQTIVLFTVSHSRVKIRAHLKIPPRQDRQSLDCLLLPDKAHPGNYHLVVADNTSELLVVRIAAASDYHQLAGLFTVYLDDLEANLFRNASLCKESSALSFLVLTGSLDTKLALTLLEIDADNRCILANVELKDVPLNTKDGLEIFQEKVFSVVDLGGKNLLMFCSHSIK
jgi:hypothetical protein